VDVVFVGNATNGKEIVLCSAKFTLHDVLKRIGVGRKPPSPVEGTTITSARLGIFITEMNSQYCENARLYVELATAFKPLLYHPAFSPIAPLSPKNPLQQRYVFYSEEDYSSPMVYAEEFALEPRIATKV
jgi:hypothetical protein